MSAILRLLLLLLLFNIPVEAYAHTIITRTSDRERISLSQLASAAGNFDVILIGESHDDRYHHELQLDLIRALWAGKTPLAIGLEMMQSDHQEQLDLWVAGRLTEPMMQAVFQKNWSDWEMYRDIFVFARDNKIPMVALNVPIRIVRKVAQHGFGALTPEERGALPAGTSCDLKSPQIAFLRGMFKTVEHHGVNGRAFSNFCEAQTVRNSGMAINLARYAEKEPGRKIVVLAGIWHAVKYAVPEQLQRQGYKLSCTVILPETPYLSGNGSGSEQADYLVLQ